MKKESLIKAREILFKVMNNSNIDINDKAELLINLFHFLDPESYNETIKTLRKNKRRWLYGRKTKKNKYMAFNYE